jgi:DNA polymerase-3 subunit delta'
MALARAETRGHPAAVAVLADWLPDRVPHAILVSGPASVGKTTLALDLAAALLCDADDPESRPCRSCAACRRVASGNHPDVHRLRPSGPGLQIKIGGGEDGPGVRELISELALLPAEGRARIGIIEAAQRMNESAQNALLTTLEEPPDATVIVLCTEDEDRLLPTIRSRCARIRLGPVGVAPIEELLGERGVAEPPAAARLARLSGGRPGFALALARRPEAVRSREELMRRLVDLAAARPADRLVAAPSLMSAAKAVAAAIDVPSDDEAQDERPAATPRGRGGRQGQGRGGRAGARPVAKGAFDPDGDAPVGSEAGDDEGDVNGTDADSREAARSSRRGTASERRADARALLDVWRSLARDVAVAAVGGRREVGETALLEEVVALADRIPPGAAAAFLERLDATERLLGANASPDLAVDTLLLAWPRTTP